MDISVVVPLFNEEESLPELSVWIKKIMDENNFSYEIVMIDDGSKDNSWQVIEKLQSQNSNIKGIKFRRNYGKSAALFSGFDAVKGDVVITMDADLQDSPDEIPELFRMIKEDGFDLVSGWKKKRFDPVLSKNIPSKFYNWTVRRITGIKLHDMNCGLKAYRKNVIKSIEVYGEMHRYIPVLAKWAGYNNIGEKVVVHSERKYGITKFGLERFIRGPLDLLSVTFISRFVKSPMHFFGILGIVMVIVGLAAAIWLAIEKIIQIKNGIIGNLITNSPYFYIALTSMIIGAQFFLGGFLGELISRSSSDRNTYKIEKKTFD
ncbi:MAG: glycosyltransferase family 2 protein [Prolixibacteraceae bacterium]|mgnify:CR=1 FL=1|jgi:glycosyltransferase involved in cell wall biosynthesis|nr:glycosyltransferase family 2 protein [Prolixibacteraceae bacterium]MBT6004263.1 glycosyltransferase family 2 protein [Prolixibacteraceae bacterium]MBT6765796.1 glycosyltransferase family 2 protein [Prolixibacteraceae bacterium]MBT6997637.1 glycosyltransferase family 2 protein [Prolixibacteraceae bacterium]MBT7394944.1 glycosyltransferase family 2 protein [Prolixibacteraceae bacterium]